MNEPTQIRTKQGLAAFVAQYGLRPEDGIGVRVTGDRRMDGKLPPLTADGMFSQQFNIVLWLEEDSFTGDERYRDVAVVNLSTLFELAAQSEARDGGTSSRVPRPGRVNYWRRRLVRLLTLAMSAAVLSTLWEVLLRALSPARRPVE